MGMDVVGQNPSNETGAAFRNNVWWWHPLWSYCEHVLPEICSNILGHSNDGDGLDRDQAVQLAAVLRQRLADGDCARYEVERNTYIAELPRVTCDLCSGTGVRTDDVGLEMGMPSRVLDEAARVILGRDAGWCNGCQGEGTSEPFEASYQFDCENVARFAAFLEQCGGFAIY